MSGPLEGIKVLDLSWVLAGPFASMILCDLGAEVVKVERPDGGDVARGAAPLKDGVSYYFFSINRGKKSITVDLKSERGRELFLRLVKEADVLLENFVPGTMAKLGLSYEVIREQNPALIYAACSGFGQTGPYANKPALDIVVQGMGGIMSITGEPGGGPVRPGTSLGDITAGLFTAIGILAALQERNSSGLGQMVDISMLDCQVAILENAFARYFATGEIPGPLGTRHPSATPFQAFPTKDGHIVLALSWGLEDQWALFCAKIDRVDLIDDPRFETGPLRTQHHSELEPLLIEVLRTKTTAEWIKEFEEIDMPCGPINTIDKVAADPQIKAREMLVEISHPQAGSLVVPNTPVKLSRTPGRVDKPAPELGEHTAEILSRWLSMTEEEIEALKRDNII